MAQPTAAAPSVEELVNLVRALYRQLETASPSQTVELTQTAGALSPERAQELLRYALKTDPHARAEADRHADEASRESFPASDAPAY